MRIDVGLFFFCSNPFCKFRLPFLPLSLSSPFLSLPLSLSSSSPFSLNQALPSESSGEEDAENERVFHLMKQGLPAVWFQIGAECDPVIAGKIFSVYKSVLVDAREADRAAVPAEVYRDAIRY